MMKGLKRKNLLEECPSFSKNTATTTTTTTLDDHDELAVDQPLQPTTTVAASTAAAAEGDGEVDHDDEEEDDEDYEDGEEDNLNDDEQQQQERGERNGQHRLQFRSAKNRSNGDSDRPKLDEGYYEIEAVRRKRVRKGQLQYLIKWRGWAETANTWEPLDNLQSCSDVIDAFEESLQSGKHRSSRKRKRKYGATHIQPKKKLQQPSTTDTVRTINVRISDKPMESAPINDRISDKPMESAPINDSSFADTPCIPYQHDQPVVNTIETSVQAIKNGPPTSDSSDIQERKECNGLDMTVHEHKGTPSADENNVDTFALHFQEGKASTGDEHVDGPAKVIGPDPVQNNRCTGARRRKSGSVKRFKQDTALSKPNDTQIEMTRISVDSNCRAEPPDTDNNFDGSKNVYAITEIIKPVSYMTSVTNNFQEVLVTFAAKRSDGKEVMVDNKFLKANNPLLLINFYERHLRYSPTQ